MINLSDRVPAQYSKRARAELSAAWEHLLTAAQETARQVGDTSRARGSVARDRAALARLALRGELSTLRWRWAGAGLAAGLIIGLATAAALTRRPRPAGPAAEAVSDTAREKVTGVESAVESAPPRAVPATDSDDQPGD